MIAETGKLFIFFLGFILALLIRRKRVKGYEIKEFKSIKNYNI
jgi:hypothetical protein